MSTPDSVPGDLLMFAAGSLFIVNPILKRELTFYYEDMSLDDQ